MFVIYLVLIFIVPFVYAGVINYIKSLWAGRKGQSIFQPLFDFIKLLKKGEVISKRTSKIFQVSPVIYFCSVLISSLFIPYGNNVSMISFDGDFIIFMYILAIGNFFMILSALDTGSSFEGMGASREAIFSIFIEPSLFLIFGSFVFLTRNTNILDILESFNFSNFYSSVVSFMSIVGILMILVSEGKRVPVDDPQTHLELTMIHEVMILDNSGIDLGLINYATYLKMTVFNAIISSILFIQSGLLFSLIGFLIVNLFSAIIVGTIESIFARFKINYIPQWLLTILGISIFIVMIILTNFGGKI
ncbi:MAG: NADH-quinone oxidoreductase subunit H [candidate division WOR-3 bacterium]